MIPWWAPLALLLLASAAFVAWHELYEVRQRRRLAARQGERLANALPPVEERPDYRTLAVDLRVCPCGTVFERSTAMVEPLCDECVKARFAKSVEADREFWVEKGWSEKG